MSSSFVIALVVLATVAAADAQDYQSWDDQFDPRASELRVPMPNLKSYDESLRSTEENLGQIYENGRRMQIAVGEMAETWPRFRQRYNRARAGAAVTQQRLKGWADNERTALAIPQFGAAVADTFFRTDLSRNFQQPEPEPESEEWSTGAKVATGAAIGIPLIGAGVLAFRRRNDRPAAYRPEDHPITIDPRNGPIRITKDMLERVDPGVTGEWTLPVNQLVAAAARATRIAKGVG